MKFSFKTSNYEKYYKSFVPYLKKEKGQKYFTITLSICASIFFLLFAINPTLSTIAKLKKQISDAKFVEGKLSEKVNNLSSLSQQYQEIQDDIPFVLDAVPQTPQVPTLVGQIGTIGQASEVTITNIQVLPVILTSRSGAKSSTFAFDITGSGNFANIQTFLNNLTNMQRAVSISSIQISKNEQNDNIDFIISGNAYFKK